MWLSVTEAVCFHLAALSAACSAGTSVNQTQGAVWISPEEIRALPTSGAAWHALVQTADAPLSAPNLSGRDDNADVQVLARALVYVRAGGEHYKDEIVRGIVLAMGTESCGDVLSLARNLPGYVIAAELVGLPPPVERIFRDWLAELPDRDLEGQTLRQIHEKRPNNWGTHAGGARAVIARYLGDAEDLARVAQVFHGWLGDRASYDGFAYGELDWQADPEHPVGINPKGSTKDGHSIDGVLPDDQRRSGGFAWPPPKENYCYEALQGALLQAMVLSRAGYEIWEWNDRALLRAFQWLEREADFPTQGDDTWQPFVINHFYRADLRTVVPARPGKNVGWTDWTLGAASSVAR